MQGTVKWFNEMKGFGFIIPAEGGQDVFVHKSEIQGFGRLATGDRVKYDLDSDAKGPKAVNVRVVE